MILDIVTPARRLKSFESKDVDLPCETKSIILPGKAGQLEILEGHEAMLATLGTGVLDFETGGKRVQVMVSGGFFEIDRDKVTVLCEDAALAEEVHAGDTRDAHNQLQQQLADMGATELEDPEFSRLKAETERAASKLSLLK